MGDGHHDRGAYSNNEYFRMGAAVAVGELYDMAAFGSFLTDDDKVRSYLGSFGVKGPYRRDFERLYSGKGSAD